MTGELTLTGRVLPIGGLREKSTAAYTRGIRTLLIPKDNMRDIAELDSTVRSEMTFIPCETLSDVLSNALVSQKKTDDTVISFPESDAQEEAGKSALHNVILPAGNERSYGSV